jgi:hypothetical protein
MIRPTRLALTAAVSLLSALSTQAANIKISSLPFAITAPGTYVVTANLSSSASTNVAAITISTAIQGPVLVDLKGFTLTGANGDSVGVGIGSFAGTQSIPNTYPITVRNGTLRSFAFGIWAENNAVLSSIDLQNVEIFTGGSSGVNSAGVIFSQVQLSTISNCSFYAGANGIDDYQSPGGNLYTNDSFTNVNPLFVSGQNGGVTSVINRCAFQAPTN